MSTCPGFQPLFQTATHSTDDCVCGRCWADHTLEEKQGLWNARAALGPTAGTQDLMLKALEQRALVAEVQDYTQCAGDQIFEVLELGCGLGETACLIAGALPGYLLAVDTAAAMIAAAGARRPVGHWTNLTFALGDATCPPPGPFDLIYSQRCLINLPTWDAQHTAIRAIADRLVPGGRYLMCEHSQDGLEAINATRGLVRLPAIQPPWHNRYLQEAELATVTCLRLVRCEAFSATYYFLSRIVNATLAHDRGEAPAYDAPINQLAWTLPPVGPWAQGRLWIWEKP